MSYVLENLTALYLFSLFSITGRKGIEELVSLVSSQTNGSKECYHLHLSTSLRLKQTECHFLNIA